MHNLSIIRDICVANKMTLKELSERLGMTQNGLQHILNTNTTKIDTLEKIAETLNVSIGTFFLDTNSDFTNNKELKLLHDRIKELEYQLMEKRELISFYKEKLNEMISKDLNNDTKTPI